MTQASGEPKLLFDTTVLSHLALPLDTPASLACFARWVRRMGASDRNLGEASLCAIAELSGGTVITDDADGVRVGRANGLDFHGTVWRLG